MGEFWARIRKSPLGWVLAIIAVADSIWSRYLDYRDTVALGLSHEFWLGAGLLLFFVAVLIIVYQSQKQTVAREVGTSNLANQIMPPTHDKPLEFMIKAEEISIRRGSYLLNGHFQEEPQYLVMNISFKTSRVIQIASIHLEINSIDPRDIYKPSPHLVQGFQLPHILNQSETREFQFEILPAKKRGDYKVILKVLAGGDWYSDGPHSIDL